jgi:hypothetical protein
VVAQTLDRGTTTFPSIDRSCADNATKRSVRSPGTAGCSRTKVLHLVHFTVAFTNGEPSGSQGVRDQSTTPNVEADMHRHKEPLVLPGFVRTLALWNSGLPHI